MICNNNYLADILRVYDIKDLIWYDAFSKSLSIYTVEPDLVATQSAILVRYVHYIFIKMIVNWCTLVRIM